MSTDNIDTQHLEVYRPNGGHEALTVHGGVQVIVNQAYGSTGAKLIGLSGVQFDGYPALSLFVRANEVEGMVHLSPIHAHSRRYEKSWCRATCQREQVQVVLPVNKTSAG